MSRFPTFTGSEPLIGREREFIRIYENLTKETPQHISVVAPRFFGKTVLLKAVAERIRFEKKYEAVIYWDLGHDTPQTDNEFISRFCGHIDTVLKNQGNSEADYLTSGDVYFEDLKEFFELLKNDNKRLLIIWDGFDRPLREGKFERNLWDNLRYLCNESSLVALTASREKLIDLVNDGESVTSEFWQIFQNVTLKCLNIGEQKLFLDKAGDLELSPGGVTELDNWTGGIPALVPMLLNELPSGCIDNKLINEIAENPSDLVCDTTKKIINDLTGSCREWLQVLASSKEENFSDVPRKERGELLRSGLVRKSGNKIKSACRFAINAIDCGSNLSIHKKLFQTEVDYRKNIRSVLEHRLSHLNRFDERLFLMVERSIRSLPDFPEICLNDFSQVSGWAFDIIWQREFGSTARVPQALIEEWTQKYQKFPKPIRVMMDQDNWNIKRDVPTQLAILQLLTGSHQDFQESRAKSTSKDVYVLLNAIHSFRNRSEHDGGQKIPIGVAVSGLMLCIELLACLDCG